MGCGREHRMPFIFSFMQMLDSLFLFFLKYCVCKTENWGENETLRLCLQRGRLLNLPPETMRLVVTLMRTDILVVVLLNGWSACIVSPSGPGSGVSLGDKYFQGSGCSVFCTSGFMCTSEIPEALIRLHLSVNCFASGWSCHPWSNMLMNKSGLSHTRLG